MAREEPGLFSALLRYWRTRRGLSQLDLALAAEVSSRHVSFLETGRAQPSREMVLLLGAALDVPLRDQNVLLHAAGFSEEFADLAFARGMPSPIERALERMLAQQEPYPLTVLNRRYDVLRTNAAAARLLSRMVVEPSAMTVPLNLMHVLFNPRLARSFVLEWEHVARTLLSRLHREALARPNDMSLRALITELLTYADVPSAFHAPDFSAPSDPTLIVRLARDDLKLAFLTTMTVFNAPQNVTLDELRIESYFPLDDATARACEELARD